MIFWYKLLTYLFFPFAKFYLVYRKLNNKEHPERYKEKLSHIKKDRESGFILIGDRATLSKICTGVFIEVKTHGICMIGKKK